jgi:hypothetical protein
VRHTRPPLLVVTVAVVVILAVGAATMVPPTAAALGGVPVAATVTTHYFKTPSGNIVCGYSSGSRIRDVWVGCAIKSGLKPPPPRVHCTEGDPTDRFIGLSATGRSHVQTCAGDPGVLVYESRARVLPYGRTVTWGNGAMHCTSALAALTCTNRAGHGFVLSRQRTRRF